MKSTAEKHFAAKLLCGLVRRLDESCPGFFRWRYDEKGRSTHLQQMKAQMESRIPSIEQIERIVDLLDNGVHLPGVPMRLPLDPIVGLVPLAGDVLTLTISGCIIGHARKLGVPRSVQRKMVFNALTDCILGSVPLFGDIFDFFYKANRKNLALLKQHITAPSQRANPAQQRKVG